MDRLSKKRQSVVESIAERLESDEEDNEPVEPSLDGQLHYVQRRWWQQGRAKALLFMLTSTLAQSIYSIFVKKITSVTSAELVTINVAFSCIPSAMILAAWQINPFQFGPQWRIDIGCIAVRGAFGVAIDILRILALNYLPIGDCSTIMFSNPILVAVVAPLLLKERLLCSTIVAVGITIVGITLVSQPTFLFASSLGDAIAEHRNTGIIYALSSTVVSAFVLLALRALKRVNEHVTQFWAGVTGLIVSIAVTFIMDGGYKMPATNELVFVILAAFFLYVANLTMIMAFRHDTAARVASIRTTVVVWSYIWQVIVFADPVSILSIFGAVLVIVAILIVSSTRDHHTGQEPKTHAHVGGDVEQQSNTKVKKTFPRDALPDDVFGESSERRKLLIK